MAGGYRRRSLNAAASSLEECCPRLDKRGQPSTVTNCGLPRHVVSQRVMRLTLLRLSMQMYGPCQRSFLPVRARFEHLWANSHRNDKYSACPIARQLDRTCRGRTDSACTLAWPDADAAPADVVQEKWLGAKYDAPLMMDSRL